MSACFASLWEAAVSARRCCLIGCFVHVWISHMTNRCDIVPKITTCRFAVGRVWDHLVVFRPPVTTRYRLFDDVNSGGGQDWSDQVVSCIRCLADLPRFSCKRNCAVHERQRENHSDSNAERIDPSLASTLTASSSNLKPREVTSRLNSKFSLCYEQVTKSAVR